MNIHNHMRLSFPAKSINESFGRTAVCAFVGLLDPTVEEICDIKTAVSEAITNCIVHAYPDRIGMVYISARIKQDHSVVIRIKDEGCGIPDITKAMEPLYTSCPSGERAGLGFAVMTGLMDRVKVYSVVDKGTTVVLERKIASKAD